MRLLPLYIIALVLTACLLGLVLGRATVDDTDTCRPAAQQFARLIYERGPRDQAVRQATDDFIDACEIELP